MSATPPHLQPPQPLCPSQSCTPPPSQPPTPHFRCLLALQDIGHDPSNPLTRLYATSAAQPYHNDAADLVSLLCLRPARSGGLSSWSSSITTHNEILRRAPHLGPVLAGPWWVGQAGQVWAGWEQGGKCLAT